jgi:16S rRNA (uracil1498-N3)-methyltransferase
MPRIYCPTPLPTGALVDLPAGAARHVQVLRLQPGDALTLFNGEGGEVECNVTHMGRSTVQVQVGQHHAIERAASRQVHLAICMPANERMDWLVEKATELGVASIQPLMSERTVLRLSGERAEKKLAHWSSVAVAACEQCGGNQIPVIHPVMTLTHWLQGLKDRSSGNYLVLSLAPGTQPLRTWAGHRDDLTLLLGPEGGLAAAEEASALAQGFQPISLGPRVLRTETAAVATLAALQIT